MSRTSCLSLAAAVLFAMAAPGQTDKKKTALDKPTLEAYVRHLYVMDSRINMQISDPKPSTQLPGFLEGTVYDAASNPFKNDLDKLKTESEPSLGTPGAPVVIVEFSDFQCPYCKEEAKMLRQNLLTAYPTQVRLYFKTFPLESLHPWAKPAAIASRCIYQQQPGAFWTFHD